MSTSAGSTDCKALKQIGLGSPPWIIGHRGARGEAPENTIKSFLLAIEQKADMVEFDVQLTADHQLIIFHDWSINSEKHGRIQLEEAAFDDIKRPILAHFGAASQDRTEGVMPTLRAVLHALPGDYPLNIELKRKAARFNAFVRELAEVTAGRKRLLVSSFDWDLLAEVKRVLPQMPVAPLAENKPGSLLDVARELNSCFVGCNHGMIQGGLLEQVSESGMYTLVYTVNKVDDAKRLLSAGVAGIFTDYPGRLRDGLASVIGSRTT